MPVAVPPGVRPTSARVREALFSIVGHQLDGVRVLDAFGGSGLLALEAWSRGAEVVVVERDRRRSRRIKEVVESLQASIEVVTGDVTRRAAALGVFDLVLVDPPYADAPAPVLQALAPAVGHRLVLEQPSDRPAPAQTGLQLARTRTYGGTALHLYEAQGG